MATEKVKQTQTKVAPTKPVRLIYLGPNLMRYGLTKYAVYKGGLPDDRAKEALEKWPLLKLLFVPPAIMCDAENAIRTLGTLQNEAYKQINFRSEA